MLGYIDGTTGGMMLQLIMAGIVGGFVAFKLVARNFITSLFGRMKATRKGEVSPDSDETSLPSQ